MDSFQKNEPQIIARFKLGDKGSYAQIYLFYYKRLIRYAFSLTQGEVEAEDIIQDVFVNLWEKRNNIQNESSLRQYLYRCVYNAFIDNYRKQGKRIKALEELRMQVAMTVDADMKGSEEELLSSLRVLIEELPKKRKKIFEMNKLQKYKYKEIAEELNISERTVEGQIRKAVITLQKRILDLRIHFIVIWLLNNYL